MLPINTVNYQISYLLPDPEKEIYRNIELLLIEKKEINVYDICLHLNIRVDVAKRIMERISRDKIFS